MDSAQQSGGCMQVECRNSVDLLGKWAAMVWGAVFFFLCFFCVCFFLEDRSLLFFVFFPFRPPALILLLDPDEKQRKKTTRPYHRQYGKKHIAIV